MIATIILVTIFWTAVFIYHGKNRKTYKEHLASKRKHAQEVQEAYDRIYSNTNINS
jgi:hypothetical protein